MLWWTLRQLRSKKPRSREKAAKNLGQSKDPRAVEPLLAALKDEVSNVRAAGAEALEMIHPDWLQSKVGKEAIAAFVAALGDKDEDVREGGARALGQIGSTQTVEPLVASITDKSNFVRAAAASALGEIGDARAVEPLIAALNDRDRYVVQIAAAESLGKIDPNWRQSAAAKQAIPTFMVALKDEDSSVRAAATQALGIIGDKRAIQPLIAALRDEAPDVRWTAVIALGKIGDACALDPLVAALKDEDLAVRKLAAAALDRIDPNWSKAEPMGRKVYLIPLWDTEPWPSSDLEELLRTLGTQFGCPTRLLAPVKVKGPFPTEPDEYVVDVAFLACQKVGIHLDSVRDTISFRGDLYRRPGVHLGLITIKVNAPPT